ncbi:hypothetical protein GA0070613_0365 [Micromonospora inositola]|uniref:Uncharacterized protein n=1 Tax=Micromonospora inositola TaxID=47865 RepID=A0A1C5GTK2_9ACTN|nr:hypothetical protein GA0070613_0365 [Micromonospora inositola]
MIVWLNGAFGAGRTTVSAELCPALTELGGLVARPGLRP